LAALAKTNTSNWNRFIGPVLLTGQTDQYVRSTLHLGLSNIYAQVPLHDPDFDSACVIGATESKTWAIVRRFSPKNNKVIVKSIDILTSTSH
jgi:hypothetical protein